MRAFLARLFLLLGLLAAGLPAWAAGRVALLIGNAAYDADDFALKNPANDARALGAALEGLGFTVTVVTDADRKAMREALVGFGAALRGAEIGLFFYAGHGVQAAGENLLLGRDLAGLDAAALDRAAITLTEVRRLFEAAKPSLGVIVLDACRDTPASVAGRGVPKGLARAATGAGLLVAYATDPGSVAYDGTGANSIFTSALLRHLATPALDIRLMFGRVRQDVVLATEGRQVPWVEESVIGEFVLNTDVSRADILAKVDRDVARWREVSGTIRPEPYRDYLREFPDGLFRQFAEERIARFSMVPLGTPAGAKRFDVAGFVEKEDGTRLSDALVTLGFLPDTRGLAPVADRATALEAYVARQPDPAAFDPRTLYTEAARLSVFLGVRLAQRIRSDIVALGAIDRAQKVALATYAEIEALARTDPEAEKLLPVARLDLDAIAEAQVKVLGRLDQSREYYDRLVQTAGGSFGDWLTPQILGLDEATRSVSELGAEADRDIRLFLKHARIGQDDQTRGTLSWLSDFLPKA